MAAFSPSVLGAGSELTPEEWLDIVVTPLQADSVILSMPGVNSFCRIFRLGKRGAFSRGTRPC